MSRILLVDDDANVRDALSVLLESADHCVTVARNGVEGIRLAHETEPEIIVSDVMMPSMDGPEMVRRLRFTPRFREVPVVLMSAFVDVASVPVAAMLHKPFEPAQLLHVLEKLAGSPGTRNDKPDPIDNHVANAPMAPNRAERTTGSARCGRHICRAIILVDAQRARVHKLQSTGIDARLAIDLCDSMNQSVVALQQFQRIVTSMEDDYWIRHYRTRMR